jgi:hypothetical protein
LCGSQEETGEVFKKTCQDKISKAMEVLDRDLGWGDYLINVAKSIANAVISVFTSNPNRLFAYATSVGSQAATTTNKELQQVVDPDNENTLGQNA